MGLYYYVIKIDPYRIISGVCSAVDSVDAHWKIEDYYGMELRRNIDLKLTEIKFDSNGIAPGYFGNAAEITNFNWWPKI